MSESLNLAYQGIDREYAAETAATRRRFVQGAAAAFGGLGLMGLAYNDDAVAQMGSNDPKQILDVAATAEVLATIVNTVGGERVSLDRVTRRNVQTAAREELIHFKVLRSLGAKPATKRIWVPNKVFATSRGLLETLEAGDQIFINAYLIGTTVFGNAGKGTEARYTGEFMGVEAVHRALARQSLGKLGNDRAFMLYEFTDVNEAVARLQAAGFGFGEPGARPGRFYDFDRVRERTPNFKEINTRSLQ